MLPKLVAAAEEHSSITLTCRALGHAFLTSKLVTQEAQSRKAASYVSFLSLFDFEST